MTAATEIDWSKPVRMTEAEYLAFEEQSEEKHEFDDGIVRPLSRLIMFGADGMAGGAIEHGRRIMRASRVVSTKLVGTGCEAFPSDVAVKARNDTRYSYPDLSIVCGKVEGDPIAPERIINNPICVIEVLSPGTADYDRTDKFEKYARIESLREYVLIEHDRPVAQTLYREADGRWTFANFQGRDAVVKLRSVAIDLPLAALFDEPADGAASD